MLMKLAYALIVMRQQHRSKLYSFKILVDFQLYLSFGLGICVERKSYNTFYVLRVFPSISLFVIRHLVDVETGSLISPYAICRISMCRTRQYISVYFITFFIIHSLAKFALISLCLSRLLCSLHYSRVDVIVGMALNRLGISFLVCSYLWNIIPNHWKKCSSLCFFLISQ